MRDPASLVSATFGRAHYECNTLIDGADTLLSDHDVHLFVRTPFEQGRAAVVDEEIL